MPVTRIQAVLLAVRARRTAHVTTALLIVSAALLAQDGTWSAGASLPGPRQEMYSAALDGAVYVAGGMVAADTLSTDWFARYVVANDTWQTLPSLPITLHHAPVTALGGEIWLTGGWTGKSTLNSRVFVYTPATARWREVVPLPFAVAAAAAFTWNGKLYLVGGSRSDSFGTSQFGKVQRYDPANGTWRTDFPELPWGRNHISAVVLGSTAYISPGRPDLNKRGKLNNRAGHQFHAFDLATSTWRTLADPRDQIGVDHSGSTFAGVNGKLYLLGGEPQLRTNAVYDPATDRWSRLADTPDSLPGFHGTWGVAIGASIFVPGGGDTVGAGGPSAALRIFTVPPTVNQ